MVNPLAVSLGDPAGVGPELIAEAWARRRELDLPPFFVVGGFNLLTAAAESRGTSICAGLIQDPRDAARMFDEALPVIGLDPITYRPGAPDQPGASLALSSLKDATRIVAEGHASGLVTGPIAKSKLASVGFTYPGQTEFVAAHCGVAAEDAVMMLAGPRLRTIPLTVHIPLDQVAAVISTPLVIQRARIAAAALQRDYGIANPRIAIAALNPHAGEDGRMGNQEAEIIAPAIAALQAEGMAVTGPHPADALFTPRAREGYDAALCMYHDQALIPLKALDFDEGVNVTLGLPIVRTSPDHGTAFDIAGKGLADPGAMIAAIRMAGEVAARRAAT
ncbi:MAG: 4-hydroxythreonine-4-phosphate dehydrogenase PdxA [Novosphingobium sp.]